MQGYHQCLLDVQTIAPLKVLRIYVLHLGYHQYKNTTTNAWLKPVLDFQGSTRLFTILSYVSDVTEHAHNVRNFLQGVQIDRLIST